MTLLDELKYFIVCNFNDYSVIWRFLNLSPNQVFQYDTIERAREDLENNEQGNCIAVMLIPNQAIIREAKFYLALEETQWKKEELEERIQNLQEKIEELYKKDQS